MFGVCRGPESFEQRRKFHLKSRTSPSQGVESLRDGCHGDSLEWRVRVYHLFRHVTIELYDIRGLDDMLKTELSSSVHNNIVFRYISQQLISVG